MSTASEIYTALSGSAPVAALVGARIYRKVAPQSAVRPFILYSREKGDGVLNSLDGPSLRNPAYHISCWSEISTDQAADLAEKAKTAILAAMPKAVFIADYDGEPEYPLKIYGVVLEFSVWEETD
jgi:hypothetical protein